MAGGVEQRLHRRPLSQEGLAHLVTESGQRSKLCLQGQFVLTVDVFQPTRPAGFSQRIRQLLRLYVPGFNVVLLEQLPLGKGFERTNSEIMAASES